MRIGELARLSATSVRSLRYYDAMGLLSAQRQSNGYRQFDAAAVLRVQHIHVLLSQGFTIADIRQLLPCLIAADEGTPICAVATQAYRRQLDAIDTRIRALQAIRDHVAMRLPTTSATSLEEPNNDT